MSSNPTTVPARYNIPSALARTLAKDGALVADDRRVRSSYFDGRFLTAKDLTRDQAHFATRQADLARGVGGGVVRGLRVYPGITSHVPDGTIKIDRGHGITPGGEIVVLGEDLTLRLDAVPDIERLDAAFGISRIPSAPARHRTGLYVLALRPVEYTANPVAQYPASLEEGRVAYDADVVEAVAITLIPFPERAASGSLEERRHRAVHAIFVRGASPGAREDVLPIAMVALDHGVLQWIDPYLVRREVVVERTHVLGAGRPSRSQCEAHLLQYDAHISEVFGASVDQAQSGPIAATKHFLALPPVGRIPKASIDITGGKQHFFPPEIEVSIGGVPEDELPAVLDECMLTPPIDLTQGSESLEGTSVIILVPVPREAMIFTGAYSLRDLASASADAAIWLSVIQSAPSETVWYVRRKNFLSASALGKLELPLYNPDAIPPPPPDPVGPAWAFISTYLSDLQLLENYEIKIVNLQNGELDEDLVLAVAALLQLHANATHVLRWGLVGELFAPAGTFADPAVVGPRFDTLDAGALSDIESAVEGSTLGVTDESAKGFATSLCVPEIVRHVEGDSQGDGLTRIGQFLDGTSTGDQIAVLLQTYFNPNTLRITGPSGSTRR
ncbi:hypothetical protein [Polyangium mundeleinium]|uniref:Uncharacterized protein n=1 Tax=Polyangium mundeleinium TaxID=2995306 RepID=A0ABT5F1A7_9BACT|nr:hypothetical protein [Polyangium mundeleinium]MDC0747853.1 hypothetical protein [Polyangium mundeleinium]